MAKGQKPKGQSARSIRQVANVSMYNVQDSTVNHFSNRLVVKGHTIPVNPYSARRHLFHFNPLLPSCGWRKSAEFFCRR